MIGRANMLWEPGALFGQPVGAETYHVESVALAILVACF